jgi:NADPH2:quinone reductase
MDAIMLVKTGNTPDVFEVQNVPTPTPKSNEILVKVDSFGLNYADVMARKGIYAAAPPLPSILGYEVVGTVTEIGSEVTQHKVGDRVLAFTRFGAYAQYAVANAVAAIQLPSNVPDAEATALATQYCTAIYMAEWKANIRKGETVLIHAAAGGVGHALIQIAKKVGCKIIGTAGSAEKIAYLKSIGVDIAINYQEKNFADEIIAQLGERAVDVVFDPVGGTYHKQNRKLLAIGGRLVMFGISSFSNKKGTKWDQLQLAAQFGILSPLAFLINSITISGVNMLHIAEQKPEIIGDLLQDAINGFEAGYFIPKIALYESTQHFFDAHLALSNRNTIGKVAIHW